MRISPQKARGLIPAYRLRRLLGPVTYTVINFLFDIDFKLC